ncbi:MAG: hypothetical protein AAGB93_09355 [Planctomycetota bacterium]
MQDHRTGSDRGNGVLGLRIMLLAFVAGVTMFAVVATVLGPLGGAAEEPLVYPLEPGAGAAEYGSSTTQLLEWIVLGYAVLVIPGTLVLRRLLDGRVGARRSEALEALDRGEVPDELRVATILPAAMAESLGLLSCVVLLLTGNTMLLVPVVLSLVLILVPFPSEDGLRSRIQAAGRA